MIPDPLQDMSSEQAMRHASLLVLVAAADGELVREEISVIEAVMGSSMLHPDFRNEVRRMLTHPPSLKSVVTKMSEAEMRFALRDAVLVAASDGQCDVTELVILNKISQEAGLEEGRVEKLLAWVEKGWNWMDEGLDIIQVDQNAL